MNRRSARVVLGGRSSACFIGAADGQHRQLLLLRLGGVRRRACGLSDAADPTALDDRTARSGLAGVIGAFVWLIGSFHAQSCLGALPVGVERIDVEHRADMPPGGAPFE